MSYKKLLGVILIIIAVMFTLMLTTSYAWYSFSEGSTSFNASTNNDDISVSFRKGDYIDTDIAVPIDSSQVDKYSEKNNFVIKVKDSDIENSILVTISLVDISISPSLQNENFKVDLYYQGSSVASYGGNTIGTSGATTKTLANVSLDNNIDNNFELRVYILDNDTDQSSMMNQTFQARVQVDVVSRLKVVKNDFSNPDIYVSSITIDDVPSNYLPVDGYYTMTSSCTKGSTLSWDGVSKTITYESGAMGNDSCSLAFTSATSTKLLNTVEPGSYIKYTGSNGCDGNACEGQNANYVDDNSMGYCGDSSFKFITNGWRVGYIKDSTAYLISAGAPECVVTYVDGRSSSTSTQTLSTNYYYGRGYKLDSKTGRFTLTGVTSSTLAWSSNYESIIENTPYTCLSNSATGTCTTLYEVTAYSSTTQGITYPHYNYETTAGVPLHLAHLNQVALKYCNKDYAYGGVCNSNSAWAMNADDFQNITGKALSSSSCYNEYSDKSCGYTNDLIDNGGYYWYATPYSSASTTTSSWNPAGRFFRINYSNNVNGVRAVLRLESSILVVGGTGTYEDPYQLIPSN